MAALQAILEEKKKAQASCRQNLSRFRLVADPCITVDQLQCCFESYMRHKQCSDFMRLVSPPPSVATISWQSPPCPEWLVKIAVLAYDVFAFAENTKLQSVKVKRALNALYLNRQLSYSQNLGSPESAFDRIDLTLRIGLNQFRELKVKETLKSRVFRSLPRDDQIQLEIVLDKVVLPKDAYGPSFQDGDSQEMEAALHLAPEEPHMASWPLRMTQPNNSPLYEDWAVCKALPSLVWLRCHPFLTVFCKKKMKPCLLTRIHCLPSSMHQSRCPM